MQPDPAIGQENIYTVRIREAEVPVSVGKGEVDLDAIKRTIRELEYSIFIKSFKSQDRLVREFWRVNAGGEEQNGQKKEQITKHREGLSGH